MSFLFEIIAFVSSFSVLFPQVYNEELLRSGGLQRDDVNGIEPSTYVHVVGSMSGTFLSMYRLYFLLLVFIFVLHICILR